MKKLVFILLAALSGISAYAQLLFPANGGSAKASVGERIGITDVTITYGRPAVRGREGKIWGDVVYTGFRDQGFGNGIAAPWRAGANENTIIEFSTDVMIEGKNLPAGKYGFFVAYTPQICTLIFSSNTSSWGSFFYDPKEDVLRVTVVPVAINESRERLTYEFGNETDSTATISLMWEKLAIPFTVATHLQQLQLASFERELRGEKGFDPHSLVEISEYLLQQNIYLEKALGYINRASFSMPTFHVYMTKGQILQKMNKQAEADSMEKVALNAGTAQQVHNYARLLLNEQKSKEAFDVFQFNYKRTPNTYTTNMGMARGYSAIGKSKDALKYATQALPQAPDEANKKAVESMISKLKESKPL